MYIYIYTIKMDHGSLRRQTLSRIMVWRKKYTLTYEYIMLCNTTGGNKKSSKKSIITSVNDDVMIVCV